MTPRSLALPDVAFLPSVCGSSVRTLTEEANPSGRPECLALDLIPLQRMAQVDIKDFAVLHP